MCHHAHDAAYEAWMREQSTDEDEEADAEPEDPSFAQDERDVDVDLLEADDD